MAILKVDTVSGIGTEGPVFEGDIEFTSQNFLTLPKGDTTQRGRGRGMIMGGFHPAIQTMEYVSIQSQGNSIAFGDMSTPTQGWGSALASSTRACIGGGGYPSNINTIEFVTIASTGNAQDFGDSSMSDTGGPTQGPGICASPNRIVFFGGYITGGTDRTTEMQYVNPTTKGDSTRFGDLETAQNSDGNGLASSHGGL